MQAVCEGRAACVWSNGPCLAEVPVRSAAFCDLCVCIACLRAAQRKP